MENQLLPRLSVIFVLLFALIACNNTTQMASSEIVYGPIDQVYEMPVVSGTVYFVSPDGASDASGIYLNKPTSIEEAISRVVSGDAIVMRGGEYRTGNLTFNQGVVIQPYLGEKPVLKGTLIADKWAAFAEGVWVTKWDFLFPAGPEDWWRREREEKFTPMHRFNNDGVFIDGEFLQSVGTIEDLSADTYFVDYDNGEIFIGSNPNGKLVEITAFRKAIFRTIAEVHGKISDERGPIIRGLEITQYPDTMVHIDGYYPQGNSMEHEHGKDVVGTVFENCTFSKCFRIGVFAIGNNLVMRNCKIVDTNTEGLYVVASNDVLLERNIFEHNNIENWTGFFPAAVKIFNQSYRVTCRENLVINHPNSNGIWYDVGNVDGVFVNNRIEGVGSPEGPFRDDQVWPSSNGFFFEISSSAICAGNVFVNNNQGILILNSSDVDIYNNTFINSRVSFGRDARGDDADHFGWHIFTGPGVDERENHTFVNNIMVMDEEYSMPMLYVWQPSNMCSRLTDTQLSDLDNNVYVRRNASSDAHNILWSPFDNEKCQAKIISPSEINELYPNFSSNSILLNGYQDVLFADEVNDDLHLSANFNEFKTPKQTPEKILAAMGLDVSQSPFLGAYPSK